ncbi:MAG: hypothetical protein FD177_215 [Desulfovibrionaceae bacterium]|nr:MAG: hypothetical protein FD177_215 [Desulfovibrionaceae bacterium]
MRIPAFALGGTSTPYSEASSPSAGQQAATQTLGRAKMVEASAISTLGDMVNTVSKDVRDFTRRIEEQEAITYVQSKRAAAELEGVKAVAEWEGGVSGPEALKAPAQLQERLGTIKANLLEDAPSPMARQKAEQDIDLRMAHFSVQGEKVARAKFKDYSAEVQDRSEQVLLRGAYMAKGDPNQLQTVIDQGKAAWMAHGVAGVWTSPAEAELSAGKFENKAVVAFIQGQLDDPKYARKAIAEFRGGVYADKLDTQQLIKLGNQVDATEKHIIAEGRRAQAEAKAALGESQDKLSYTIWEDIKGNPEAARGKYDLKTISALVDSGKLRPAQAQHFYDLAQGTIKQSDPVVVDTARRMAAKGELSREWLMENEKHMSGGDYLNLTDYIGRKELQQPDTQSAVKQVDILFNTPGIRAEAKYDENLRASITDATVKAEEHIKKRVQSGINAQQALSEAVLEYSPELNAAPAKNRYVSAIPERPEDVAPAYKQLNEDLSSRRLTKDEFMREWRALNSIVERSKDRKALKDKIESFKRKEAK